MQQEKGEKLNTKDFVYTCFGLLRRSSEIISEVAKGGELQKEFKKGDDPVTQADLRSQYVVINGLRKRWPNLTIIGEETEEKLIESPFDFDRIRNGETQINELAFLDQEFEIKDLVVYVDPLDGTRSFVSGKYDFVTTLIGLAYKNKPLLGIVDHIWSEGLGTIAPLVYVGIQGHHSVYSVSLLGGNTYQLKKKYEALPKVDPKQKLRVSYCADSPDPKGEFIFAKVFPDCEKVGCYGMGRMHVDVINGAADAYVLGTSFSSKWDTLAGGCLVNILGGEDTNLLGKHYSYTGDNSDLGNIDGVFLAKDKEYHGQIIGKIAQVVQTEYAHASQQAHPSSTH